MTVPGLIGRIVPAGIGRPLASALPVTSAEGAAAIALLLAGRLPWADAPARALGLRPLTLDGLSEQLVGVLRGQGGIARIRTVFGTFLAPTGAAEARELLAAALAQEAVGSGTGLDHAGRRRALSRCLPGTPVAAPARSRKRRIAAVAAEEAERLLDRCSAADRTLSPQAWAEAARRIARRLVVGDAAAEDGLLSHLAQTTAEATGGPREAERVDALARRLALHLGDPAEPTAAADTAADGPSHPIGAADTPATTRALALGHALCVVTEALHTTARQALALTAQPEGQDSAADEAARTAADSVRTALWCWPPLVAVSYRTTAPLHRPDGRGSIPAGSQLLCATTWLNALDRRRGAGPATAAEWSAATATALCHRPRPAQAAGLRPCAASESAADAAAALVDALHAAARPIRLGPLPADPSTAPNRLDPDSLRIAFAERPDGRPLGRDVPRASGRAYRLAPFGRAPEEYAARVRVGADRLDGHARSLRDCADDPRWTGLAGERHRMALLRHAQHCTTAAADLRHTAARLALYE
jgi:hypothetical protein